MQRLEVSGAVRPVYKSLGVKGLNLSDKRSKTHRWQGVGRSAEPALVSQAGGKKTPV